MVAGWSQRWWTETAKSAGSGCLQASLNLVLANRRVQNEPCERCVRPDKSFVRVSLGLILSQPALKNAHGSQSAAAIALRNATHRSSRSAPRHRGFLHSAAKK